MQGDWFLNFALEFKSNETSHRQMNADWWTFDDTGRALIARREIEFFYCPLKSFCEFYQEF